ncbi:DUF3108 domain-containing protein [Spongiibacter nanhainus]|uniref:DUF3108 domain-containing protein n=1 Tax=Spongiibacter nanhainus TaxID=2794344 RepID=A0A7T4UQS9_9GAMM|nr:DUF3108 domain-containing protein [Spongiibacter nanhainus]QQD17615.1 DUF3108 domain-containing protein [Spongiibacter nanhainus]
MTKRSRPQAGNTATIEAQVRLWRAAIIALLTLNLALPAAAGGSGPDTATTPAVGINTSELDAIEPPSASDNDTPDVPPKTPTPALLPYTAEYRISYDGMSTTADRTLRKDGDTWHLAQDASIFFLKVSEEARVKASSSGLRTQQYSYRNSVSSKRNQHIIFDWEAGVVADRQARKPWQKPLSGNLSDQLGSQLQLRATLLSGRFKDGYEQTIVNKGKIKTYQYNLLGEETVESALGTVDTIKLRRHREGSSAEAIIWLAKGWNYLIVKLEQLEDDDAFSLELLNAKLDGQQLAAKSQ